MHATFFISFIKNIIFTLLIGAYEKYTISLKKLLLVIIGDELNSGMRRELNSYLDGLVPHDICDSTGKAIVLTIFDDKDFSLSYLRCLLYF